MRGTGGEVQSYRVASRQHCLGKRPGVVSRAVVLAPNPNYVLHDRVTWDRPCLSPFLPLSRRDK